MFAGWCIIERRREFNDRNIGPARGKPGTRFEHIGGIEPHEGEPTRQRPLVPVLHERRPAKEAGKLKCDLLHAVFTDKRRVDLAPDQRSRLHANAADQGAVDTDTNDLTHYLRLHASRGNLGFQNEGPIRWLERDKQNGARSDGPDPVWFLLAPARVAEPG